MSISPVSSLKNREIQKAFDLPEDEEVITYFHCTYRKVGGRLYLTANNLCFYANMFGTVLKERIALSDIVELRKKSTAHIIPNAIKIITDDHKDYLFKFLNRYESWKVIKQAWQRKRLSIQSDEEAKLTSKVDLAAASNAAMTNIAKRYKVVRELGAGGFGQTFVVHDKRDFRQYVLKKIKCETEEDAKDAMKEIVVLRLMQHPFIVAFRDFWQEGLDVYLVMEYCEGGDLNKLIEARTEFEEKRIRKWLVQICMALARMHKSNTLHRDIKPHNIFLDRWDSAKLGDFGLSTVLKNRKPRHQSAVGTLGYAAPEILKQKAYNEKSDMYALGVTLYECLTLRSAYDDQIPSSDFPQRQFFPDRYSRHLINLVISLLARDPDRRPSAQQIVDDPRFAKIAGQVRMQAEVYAELQLRADENHQLRLHIQLMEAKLKGAAANSDEPPPACLLSPVASTGSLTDLEANDAAAAAVLEVSSSDTEDDITTPPPSVNAAQQQLMTLVEESRPIPVVDAAAVPGTTRTGLRRPPSLVDVMISAAAREQSAKDLAGETPLAEEAGQLKSEGFKVSVHMDTSAEGYARDGTADHMSSPDILPHSDEGSYTLSIPSKEDILGAVRRRLINIPLATFREALSRQQFRLFVILVLVCSPWLLPAVGSVSVVASMAVSVCGLPVTTAAALLCVMRWCTYRPRWMGILPWLGLLSPLLCALTRVPFGFWAASYSKSAVYFVLGPVQDIVVVAVFGSVPFIASFLIKEQSKPVRVSPVVHSFAVQLSIGVAVVVMNVEFAGGVSTLPLVHGIVFTLVFALSFVVAHTFLPVVVDVLAPRHRWLRSTDGVRHLHVITDLLMGAIELPIARGILYLLSRLNSGLVPMTSATVATAYTILFWATMAWGQAVLTMDKRIQRWWWGFLIFAALAIVVASSLSL